MIECRKISCRYGENGDWLKRSGWLSPFSQNRGPLVLRDLELRVEKGEWVYVLGPSAGGKTTLLRCLAGLEKIAGGEIVLGGETVSRSDFIRLPHERGVGFVFQEPSLWPHLSALANVSLSMDRLGLSSAERKQQSRDWLERFGVGGLAEKFPSELSGGEAQRVTLARTLASRPSILLLDEPTSHLDLHLRGEMMELLLRTHTEFGLTTLCVLHQIEPPILPGSRAVILEKGEKIHDGPLNSLANSPQTPFILALRRHLERMPTV